jgi:hypothetical protein
MTGVCDRRIRLAVYKQPETVVRKLYVDLKQQGDSVNVVLVDEDGLSVSCGKILTISPQGVRRWSGIVDCGFARDPLGRIALNEDK